MSVSTLNQLAGPPLFELEGEGEREWEVGGQAEIEGESESEEFFGRLADLARRAAQSPALRRVGLSAARAALRGLPSVAGAVGGVPGSRGSRVGQSLGSGIAGALGAFRPDSEMEGELEGEWETETEDEGEIEGESEVNPIRRIYPQAMMEHLGHAAASAENEAEAEAFIGALLPVAARLIPRVAPLVTRALPQLVRGASSVVRMLRSSPTTRPLVRAFPTIVRRTVANIARQAGHGQSVTPAGAVRTLAQQTAQVLSNPRTCVRAYQRSRALDRNYHRTCPQCGR